jgi:N-methylhydantoinase A
MLLADLRHDFVRSYSSLWSEFDVEGARRLVDGMVERGLAALESEGVRPARRSAVAAADLRYLGQHHEVTISFPLEDLADDRLTHIEHAFHRRHEELYGFASPGRPLEIVNLHATVVGRRPRLRLDYSGSDAAGASLPRKGRRSAYLPPARAMVELEVFDGDRMQPGQRIPGPAIVEEATTTVVVPDLFDLVLDRSGSFVIHARGLELDG